MCVNRQLWLITDDNYVSFLIFSWNQILIFISTSKVSVNAKLCSNLSVWPLTSSQCVHTPSWTNWAGLWRISPLRTPWNTPRHFPEISTGTESETFEVTPETGTWSASRCFQGQPGPLLTGLTFTRRKRKSKFKCRSVVAQLSAANNSYC